MPDPVDRQLDELLQSAEWPDADTGSVQRLGKYWQRLCDNELSEDTSKNEPLSVPNSISLEQGGTNRIPIPLTIACLLLLSLFSWLAYSRSFSGNNATDDPVVKKESELDPKSKKLGSPSANFVQNAENSDSSTIEEVPVRESRVTEQDLFAAIASVQSRRGGATAKKKRMRSVLQVEPQLASKPSSSPTTRKSTSVRRSRIGLAKLLRPSAKWIDQEKLNRLADQLGSNTTSALITHALLLQLDRTANQLITQKRVSKRQIVSYWQVRHEWERWAWERVKNENEQSANSASLRLAVAVSTKRSMSRVRVAIGNESVRATAAQVLCSYGNLADLEAGLLAVNTQKQRRHLLEAMLNLPGERAAIRFLDYMKEPTTSAIAMEIANSTDQLPTAIWMNSIAKMDDSRWDSALAIANVCDRRVTDGLIQMAMEPTTSSTALIALMKSSCTDAKRFIAYAHTDQQMTGSLIMARQRMKHLKLPGREAHSPRNIRGLRP